LQNREALVYNNYSAELAESIKNKISEAQGSEMKGIIDKITDESLKKAFLANNTPDFSNA
jgi:hypothetical protein